MRRSAVAGAIVLLLSGCSPTERPEGIVERWLLALNQGAAGEPGAYAVAGASRRVLPAWSTLDPGALDTIEVGRGDDRCERFIACETRVPIRVVRVDGGELRLDAIVPTSTGPPEGRVRRVVELVEPDGSLRVPSEGGEQIGAAGPTGWLVALGVGLALSAVAELVVRLARPALASDG